MRQQEQIKIRNYRSEGFIGKYQKLVRDEVIPYQYSVLCDEAPDTEKSHVVRNFINAGKAVRGEDTGDGFYGMVFQDSDAAKWLEAVAYSLALFPDSELEKIADTVIGYIADAQDKDGYLNTYYTIKDREKRWTNLLEGHELYCSGHMMEAACAYYEATGKRVLLDVMLKNAEHIYQHFIVEGNEGYPGHPEVELALMKMYRLTGNQHWCGQSISIPVWQILPLSRMILSCLRPAEDCGKASRNGECMSREVSVPQCWERRSVWTMICPEIPPMRRPVRPSALCFLLPKCWKMKWTVSMLM